MTLAIEGLTAEEWDAINAGWGEVRRRSLERALARLVVVQPDDDLMLRCAELRATCWGQGMHSARRSTSPIAGLLRLPLPLV